MTALELINRQMDDAEFMLSQTFKGFPNEHADTKVGPLMTVRELAVHMTDAYYAAKAYLKGDKYEFGSYTASEGTVEELVSKLFAVRSEAVAQFRAIESDEAIHHASDFLVAHDHYHVGQVVLIHSSVDPEWNAYCIYDKH